MSKFINAIKFIPRELCNGIFRPTGKQREALSNFYRNLALGLYGVTAYFLWRDGFAKPILTAFVLIIATASLIGSIMVLADPKDRLDKADSN